jgi:polyphosphate kinase 2 (PPK2 family)
VTNPDPALHLFRPDAGPATITSAALRQRLGAGVDRCRPLRASDRVRPDRGLLVVLQAVNAGGKDGVIAEVTATLATQPTRIERFRRRAPGTTAAQLFDGALAAGPGRGELVFFHRSYYEELLDAVLGGPGDVEQLRAAIADLERTLTARSTTVVKVFLHIDRDEQRRRLDRRRDRPELAPLHNTADYLDQDRWDDLMDAYQKVLGWTHTSVHPWLLIPANDRAIRNSLIATALTPHLTPHLIP